ncbi:MAG: hypothetical protein ACE5FU_07520, partial [Nitrospinota bacterium]
MVIAGRTKIFRPLRDEPAKFFCKENLSEGVHQVIELSLGFFLRATTRDRVGCICNSCVGYLRELQIPHVSWNKKAFFNPFNVLFLKPLEHGGCLQLNL